eukprot:8211510-Prorocentrum_lima.AAC.1
MTSSLVGSEMCIRDRLNTTWDVVDLVGLVMEVCIQETGKPESDWEIKLSIPRTSPSHDEQFE